MLNRDAESETGLMLTNLILDMCHDGELDLGEVETLHALLSSAGDPFPAITYLRAITREILADGSLDPAEIYRLKKGMERVVQKEVREVVSTHLDSIGTPVWDDWDHEPAWMQHPATAKQIDFLIDLGGHITPSLTKGEATKMIDQLLEKRPPTPRQMMLLRFFDRLDLAGCTKEQVSCWIDELFVHRPHAERAWHRFKIDTQHSPYEKDPKTVPVGAYKKYRKRRRFLRWWSK